MSEMAPTELADRLWGDGAPPVVLDIRPREDHERWHVPGSEQIDVFEAVTSDRDAAVTALQDLPRDREIVTVCGAGERAADAAELLREMGYDATTLRNGMRGWGRLHRHASLDVGAAELVQVARPGTGCLSYVLVSDGAAAIIDPSQYTPVYESLVADVEAELVAVLETHAHADHLSGAGELAATHDVPHYLHPADRGSLTETSTLAGGQQLTVGETELEVIHTPGHTPGTVTFAVADGALLTGDTLFLESVGRPDLDGGDRRAIRERAETLHDSVQRLLAQPDDMLVLPAHHPGSPVPPETATIETVMGRNEILGRDREAFVDAVTRDVPETPANHQRIRRANVGETSIATDEARRLELGPNQCAAE